MRGNGREGTATAGSLGSTLGGCSSGLSGKAERVPDRIQIRSSDKPSNTVNTFWGLCKNPRAKHGRNSSSFRCVPEQFLSSLSCVLDLAMEVVHTSHIPGSGLSGNQAVDQIQSGLGQFQVRNSKSFLDFSHTTLYRDFSINVLRTAPLNQVNYSMTERYSYKFARFYCQ